ncbi:MAG: hypothetical protein HGB21_02860 [Nitrospirae bacterium]|nr:hypothetical protein [Nitrospirota bacterium]NTW65245.1 hypothetical protein [Nitrospirota bacterium]
MPTLDDHDAEELVLLREEVKRLRQALNRLTPSLETILKRRGFRVYKKEPDDDLLVPDEPFRDSFFELLHKYSFRLLLRDIIKHQDRFTLEQVTRYSTTRVIRSYLGYLRDIRLITEGAAGYALSRAGITSFGPTLEWYIAELLKREFGAEVFWGVKFKRPKVGGDYDVLAKLDGSLLYVEVKSSPPKQVMAGEIAAFLDRVEDLAPETAVFLMDTELRMKDKLVPMFEQELAKRSSEPPPVLRLERELFHVQERIFIVNAKESIGRNLEKVIARYVQGRRGQ